MAFHHPVSRRLFLKSSGLLLGAAAVPWAAWRTGHAAGVTLSQLEQGIQIGDVRADRAVIWRRSDRPARLLVEYDVNEHFDNPTHVRGPFTLDTTDFTARVDLTDLPNDSAIFVRVMFQDLSNDRLVSEVVEGSFRTAPVNNRAIRFLWSGDTAGQGWGINPDFGGMKIYEAMRQTQPDFFIHCGDNIYADGPIAESVTAENGQLWHNIVTPEVSKVAETLAEFRGRYKYNLLDTNIRRFNAEVPLHQHQQIDNVVWFTADVHYCAAHYYDPKQAQFQDFDPFWEFVAGPLNAGPFGPNLLDNTFGPQVIFQKTPAVPNSSPYAGLQFFGQIDIHRHTTVMMVSLKDIDGKTVFSQELQPFAPGR